MGQNASLRAREMCSLSGLTTSVVCGMAMQYCRGDMIPRPEPRAARSLLYVVTLLSQLARRCLACRAQRGPLGVLPKVGLNMRQLPAREVFHCFAKTVDVAAHFQHLPLCGSGPDNVWQGIRISCVIIIKALLPRTRRVALRGAR